MRVAGIINGTFVNGEGIRFAVFLQGCPHHCTGCHNPDTWDIDRGIEMRVEDILERVKERSASLFDGITLSGGEPYLQQDSCIELIRRVKSRWEHWNVWCYTGYRYEDVKDEPLTKYIDVLVDGPFDIKKKDSDCKFRGSSNQRILHLYNGRVLKSE